MNWADASPSAWFVDGEGALFNLGARALVARGDASDIEDAAAQIRRVLVASGLPAEAIASDNGRLRLDAAVLPPPDTSGAYDLVAGRATACPRSGAAVVAGERWDVGELAHEVGRDALTWAWLRTRSPQAQPPSLDVSARVLASRTDTNPLALVRRAHARLALRGNLTAHDTRETNASGGRRIPPAAMSALALVHQGAQATVRTGRTNAVILAVEGLADVSLRALETETSDSRTDLTWVLRARSVLAGALNAAEIAAPVPY